MVLAFKGTSCNEDCSFGIWGPGGLLTLVYSNHASNFLKTIKMPEKWCWPLGATPVTKNVVLASGGGLASTEEE